MILPDGAAAEVRDWTSPEVPQGSNYGDAGIGWWGVYLLSIYLPRERQ